MEDVQTWCRMLVSASREQRGFLNEMEVIWTKLLADTVCLLSRGELNELFEIDHVFRTQVSWKWYLYEILDLQRHWGPVFFLFFLCFIGSFGYAAF